MIRGSTTAVLTAVLICMISCGDTSGEADRGQESRLTFSEVLLDYLDESFFQEKPFFEEEDWKKMRFLVSEIHRLSTLSEDRSVNTEELNMLFRQSGFERPEEARRTIEQYAELQDYAMFLASRSNSIKAAEARGDHELISDIMDNVQESLSSRRFSAADVAALDINLDVVSMAAGVLYVIRGK